MQLSFFILAMIRWDRSVRLALTVRERMPRREGDDEEEEEEDGRREE